MDEGDDREEEVDDEDEEGMMRDCKTLIMFDSSRSLRSDRDESFLLIS